MVEILLRAGHTMQAMVIDDAARGAGHQQSRWSWPRWTASCATARCAELMLDGVTIQKPETVTIDADVAIGMDTVVEPFAQILGRTTIGENCRIGACSIVRDSQLADGVEVAPFSMVVDIAAWSRVRRRVPLRGCAWAAGWGRTRVSATSWS